MNRKRQGVADAGQDTLESASKIRSRQECQKDFAKYTGLKRQEDREQIAKTMRKSVASSGESGIIMDMVRVGDFIQGQKKQSVAIPDFQFDYIAIHNHPSGLVFSIDDFLEFSSRTHMKMLTAMGNDGSVYVIQKSHTFSSIKCKETVMNHFKTLIGFQKDGDIIGYEYEVKRIIKECENYGVKYVESRA